MTTSLLRRVRMTVPDAATARIELSLDGWPLLLIDGDAGTASINDLRAGAMFSHVVALPASGGQMAVRTGATGDELYLLLGDVAAVLVRPDGVRSTYADVTVIHSAKGRTLFERAVRYRQLRCRPSAVSLLRPNADG